MYNKYFSDFVYVLIILNAADTETGICRFNSLMILMSWRLGSLGRQSRSHGIDYIKYLRRLSVENESNCKYDKMSNIRRTESKNLNVSRLFLQLYLCNILKPIVKSRMKM